MARPEPDQLTLVTVSHNSERELAELLATVARHLPGVRVVAVDCASDDASVEVARRADRVEAIVLYRNVGFGSASNIGVARSDTPVTALVNPDVEILDSSLLDLAAEALAPGAPERLLAPLVLSPGGSRQDTVHPAPCSIADLARALIPPAGVPGPAGVALAPWRSRTARRVGWAVGCALVARTDTLRRLGPFDESIFMYGEDMELGLRARELGVETWFWPSARVLHHGSHSSARAFGGEPFELQARARHDVVARRMGPRSASLDDAAQAVTFASRLALKRALRRPAEREPRQLRAVLAAHSGAAAE